MSRALPEVTRPDEFNRAAARSIAIRGVDFSFVTAQTPQRVRQSKNFVKNRAALRVRQDTRPVFKNLSLELGGENPVIILGPSGCGKTTLLLLLAGLLKPRAGEIAPNGIPVSMVFQEPRLLPWKTALENVSLPLTRRMGKKAAAERALYFLKRVSMEHLAAAYPDEISGGQKQRVNLARAFACPSGLLLMDEPFQSLDIPLRIELMDLTRALLENPDSSGGRLILIVTHDPREAVYLGRRIIVLGEMPRGIIFDEVLDLSAEERAYGSAAQGAMERKLLGLLRGGTN